MMMLMMHDERTFSYKNLRVSSFPLIVNRYFFTFTTTFRIDPSPIPGA